ncbi:MAG: hypothetical protein ACPL28_03225 [bacterium]
MLIKRIFIGYIFAVMLGFCLLFSQKSDAVVEIRGAICDSLTKQAIPQVRVTVANLNKSFTTSKSAFVLMLPAGEYNFILDAPEYEILNKKIYLSSTHSTFTFEMVKQSDRISLKNKYREFSSIMDSFNYVLKNLELPTAKELLKKLQVFRENGFVLDEEIIANYNYLQKFWIDSLMNLARVKEDSSSYAEAFYYYRKVAEFDSSQIEAITGVHRTDSLLTLKNKPQTLSTSQPVKKTKTPEEIEALYQSGVAKFINKEFKETLKIFKEVLKYNPGHTMAQEYLRRTEARLKILEGE